MNIVYISKYTVLPTFGPPTRQYFISKHLAQIPGNNLLLIGSRSTLGNVPEIKGLFSSTVEGNLKLVTLNGPKINLGFNWKRLKSWIIFEMNLIRFKKNIKDFQPDVVIVSSLSILTFLTGVFLKKWLKVVLVVEIRDIYPLTLVEIGSYSPSNPVIKLLQWIEKLGYRHADLLVSTLPNAKFHIEKVLKRPFKFLALPMGVDLDYYQKISEQDTKNIFERKEEDFIVGYAGTIGKANALDVVFDVAEELEKILPQIKFVFIGEGPLKNMYQKKHAELSNVIFLSAVSKTSLQPLLSKMDVLINTWLNRSIYNFGISPNKWIDYMLAGKPILVAFNGFDNIIKEANCGIIVPAENKEALKQGIIKLFNMQKEELSALGENGRRFLLEKLSYATLAKDLNRDLHAQFSG